MARFIIADLTDPRSIPKELEAIVPGLAVPVQPLLEGSTRLCVPANDFQCRFVASGIVLAYDRCGFRFILVGVTSSPAGQAD